MAGWKHFREIAAWQHARALKLKADEFLKRPQFKQQFKFCDQLSDAARSGPRNIAEGFGRFGNKEFARFVRIAKGSEAEVLNHFIDARDQELITEEELKSAELLALKAMKAAVGLIKHLEDTDGRTL
jgi:four helix bundle protein